ncbi:sensor histidine kinase [Desulfofundulus thermocisternus]|uniref:sensor histidine kinase n=1 Tax=Desulfofundulus thermocisternus TaxID=42471 RepID=UPI0004893446|nr:ATP-binding protein [Desulfofundulus thermocisternus]
MPEQILKPDYLLDICIKMLYLAGRIVREKGNFERVPRWLAEILGASGSALGIVVARQCLVYFARVDQESRSGCLEVAVDVLWCSRQNSPGNGDVPCHIFDCPVRQKVMEGCGRSDLEVTCFPMEDRKGFLMVYGEALLLNSYPITEILKAVTHFIACNLDVDGRSREAASYFLPSEDMAQLWSEMLAGLSHDLRTPLACIKGYITTLMREDVTWDHASQREFMEIIVEETDHIENLIDNLLDSATFSWKGGIELKKEPVSIPQVVRKVLTDPSFRIKNHQYTVLFPEDFPLVEADPIRIEQVLRNLVDNAVKYSMERTQITIKGEVKPGEVVVSITDQGIGIDSEHLKWLFEKFFRAARGIRENKKGMGLGLPLARQIIVSHGGRIWAESKLNQGTTFYFTLPLEQRAS